jgi:Phage portal protein, SPP1 Gp6-like
MALTPDKVPGVATRVLAMREREQVRLHRISEYMRGRHDSVYVPHGARDEYKWLLQRSVVNFLPLVVSTISENLHVDGYMRTGGGDGTEGVGALGGSPGEDPPAAQDSASPAAGLADTANPWNIFTANRMGSRQHGLHRAVAKYGIAYTVVLPGTLMGNGDSPPVNQPVVRPVSPRRLTALYADDVDDEWPQYAVEERIMRSEKGAVRVVWLYDDENRYTLVGKTTEPTLYWPGDPMSGLATDGTGWLGVPSGTPLIEEHGLGVCPVIRFLHDLDLDGEMDVSGEVEPLIPLQDQINTTTFNTLMAQQYAAFRQRWVTGMVPDDEDGRPREPFRAGVDRLFIAEDTDTKFGEFSQTDLSGFLNAREATIRHMAIGAQLPPYYLLGTVSNLSADALAASRDALDRRIAELQGVLSDPWKQTLRLASLAAGNKDGWTDTNSTVVWRDTSARSFAATADALGKMVQMLGIPATELWSRIPGITAEEVARWKQVAASQGVLAQLNDMIESQMTQGAQTTPPDDAEPFQGPAAGKATGV